MIREENITTPWSSDELCYVNDMPCIYDSFRRSDGNQKIDVVYLHGEEIGSTLQQLIDKGYKVKMPKKVRCTVRKTDPNSAYVRATRRLLDAQNRY